MLEFQVWSLILSTLAFLNLNAAQECNGRPKKLLMSSGIIKSPNYPNQHPSNQHCEWILNQLLPGQILELKIHDVELKSGTFLVFWEYRNFLTLPNGDELTSSHSNICKVYGLAKNIENCTSQIRDQMSSCPYSRLYNDEPRIKFDSDSRGKRRGFSLEYKITDCDSREGVNQIPDVTTIKLQPGAIVTSVTKLDKKAYIIVPSTLAIFVFVCACIVVARIVQQNREKMVDGNAARSEANTYEAPSFRDRAITDTSTKSELSRENMASYLSHSELVPYTVRVEPAYSNMAPSSSGFDDQTASQIDGYTAMSGGVTTEGAYDLPRPPNYYMSIRHGDVDDT